MLFPMLPTSAHDLQVAMDDVQHWKTAVSRRTDEYASARISMDAMPFDFAAVERSKAAWDALLVAMKQRRRCEMILDAIQGSTAHKD